MATRTIELTALQERALITATEEYNKTSGENLTPDDFFARKSTEYLNQMISRYRERVRNEVIQDFERLPEDRRTTAVAFLKALGQMSPDEEAAMLEQLGVGRIE